jgi:hypothetical protein
MTRLLILHKTINDTDLVSYITQNNEDIHHFTGVHNSAGENAR